MADRHLPHPAFHATGLPAVGTSPVTPVARTHPHFPQERHHSRRSESSRLREDRPPTRWHRPPRDKEQDRIHRSFARSPPPPDSAEHPASRSIDGSGRLLMFANRCSNESLPIIVRTYAVLPCWSQTQRQRPFVEAIASSSPRPREIPSQWLTRVRRAVRDVGRAGLWEKVLARPPWALSLSSEALSTSGLHRGRTPVLATTIHDLAPGVYTDRFPSRPLDKSRARFSLGCFTFGDSTDRRPHRHPPSAPRRRFLPQHNCDRRLGNWTAVPWVPQVFVQPHPSRV